MGDYNGKQDGGRESTNLQYDFPVVTDEGVIKLGLIGNGAEISDLQLNSKPRRSGLGVGGVLY